MIKKIWSCAKKAPLLHVGAVLVGGFVGALLVGLYFMPPKDSGQLASWVQAFGSVGAIGVAIFVMDRNKRHQERAKELQEKEMVESAISSIVFALGELSNIEDTLQQRWRFNRDGLPLDTLIRMPLEHAKQVTDQIPWHSPPYTRILPAAYYLLGHKVALEYYSTREFPGDRINDDGDYKKALKKAEEFRVLALEKIEQIQKESFFR